MDELGGCLVIVVVLVLAGAGLTAMTQGCDGPDPTPATQTTTRTVTKTVPKIERVKEAVAKLRGEDEQVEEVANEVVVETTTKFTPPDFTFGTIPFWILATVIVIALVPCMEYEHGFLGLACIVVFLVILQALGNTHPLEYLRDHPLDAFLYALGHYACGAIWGYAKWIAYSIKKKHELYEYKSNWLADRGASDPSKLDAEALAKLNAQWLNNTELKPVKPLARNYKSRILHWISFWEISVLWTTLLLVFRDGSTIIYRHLAKSLQRGSDFVWRDVSDQLV
jgi:hypothetical protein